MGIEEFSLAGRRALVTGSSRGIGLTLARGLAEAGAKVLLNARHPKPLAEARDLLSAEGHEVQARCFDVTDRAATAAAVDGIERDFGPIDILVNNAGVQHRAPLEDFPEAEWRRLFAVNVDGVFFVSQCVARHMIDRRRGKIVNICSVQSEVGRPSIAPYAATKGAVKMLTKGMCLDWSRHNIQVNGLGPGYFDTELNKVLVEDPAFSDWLAKRTPAGRWGRPEELIGAAVFLASPASDFVTGHILYVDGGITAGL